MTFDWTAVTGNAGLLVQGLVMTLKITGVALLAGLAGGLLLCGLRLARRRVLRDFARGYVAFFRITPELVLIFWAYFCLPPLLGLSLSAFACGTGVLALVAAAYLAEIFRAGIESVGRGQVEAARALGLGWLPLWLRILLPQAVRRMMPAFLNYVTEILKNSTLLAGIGVAELAFQAYTLGAQTFRYLELLSAIAVLFFVVIFPISLLVRLREAAMQRRTGH